MALCIGPHIQCQNLIATEGTPSLRERVISNAVCGRSLLAFAITEAGGGSDALAIETTAALDGDSWVLNGENDGLPVVVQQTGILSPQKARHPYDTAM